MKKVLFVVESLSGGGAEKVLLTLIKNLDQQKYDITIFTIVKTGVYVEELEKYCKINYALDDYSKYGFFGKIYYRIKMKIIYKLNTTFVYRWLIKAKYDIEIAFVEGFDTKFIASSSNKKSKKYAWVHIDMIERNYADYYFKDLYHHRKAYKVFDKIICVSDDAKKNFEKKFGINNLKVIYNPIDKDELLKYRNDSYMIHSPLKICAIGRLENQKGFDRLIKALYLLSNEYQDYELKIIGTGSKRKEIIQLINNYNLQDNIILTGFLNNPYVELASSNLLICSSRSEGFSLVIAEAMCLGIPILTTKCVGPVELIVGGNYGFLVENSIKGLVQGLEDIFRNKSILEIYHNKSLERSNVFDMQNILEEVEQLLDE